MKFIDTHAHLYWDSYKKDLAEVMTRSIDAGVTTIINVGVDVELSKKALRQAQGLNKIYGERSRAIIFYSTIGIHPHEALRYSQGKPSDVVSIDQDIAQLEHLYQESLDQPPDSARGKIVAVGECGLDYAFSTSEESKSTSEVFIVKNLQRQLFKAQIELAEKLNVPLIVHCRDDRSEDPTNCRAWNEVLQMIGNHPTVLHCYSGLEKTTQKILNLPNALVSFAATITYPRNEYLREAVKILPLEKIVLETDCPFLPPQSKRGQRNEPVNILEIAKLIADLKGMSLEDVAGQTTENANRFFGLSKVHRTFSWPQNDKIRA